MADGSKKAIEEIETGDKVVATDPKTGEQEAKRVTDVWVHTDRLIDLKFGNGQKITTTGDHPFWNDTDQEWQDAQDLDEGDLLLTAQWDRREVVGLDPGSAHKGRAYNLTVAGLHTYQSVLTRSLSTTSAEP